MIWYMLVACFYRGPVAHTLSPPFEACRPASRAEQRQEQHHRRVIKPSRLLEINLHLQVIPLHHRYSGSRQDCEVHSRGALAVGTTTTEGKTRTVEQAWREQENSICYSDQQKREQDWVSKSWWPTEPFTPARAD